MAEQVPQNPARSSTRLSGGRLAASSRSRRRIRFWLLLILLLAAGVRFVRLDVPPDLVFDETYYAKDACIYLQHSAEECGLDQPQEQSYVHPPLGKWIIAAGIDLFGYNSLGWRFMAAGFGVALVLIVWRLAETLFNPWTGLVAAVLVATDFLLIVQSRIAMLDIFLAFFVALGFWLIALDRQKVLEIKAQLQSSAEEDPPPRGWAMRVAAGAAFGLALAVKWSAVFPMAAAALLTFAWSVGLSRIGRVGKPARRQSIGMWARQAAVLAVAFGLVPMTVYLASYVDYFAQRAEADCAFVVPGPDSGRVFSAGRFGLEASECVEGFPGVTLSFLDLHDRVVDYHLTLKATHPYQSLAWTWPLVLRPVAYYWDSVEMENGGTQVRHILAMGNPVVWLGSLVALAWLVVRSIRRWRPESLVAAAWVVQYLPWLLVARPLFFFYLTPAVPFMMIGLAAGLDGLRRGTRMSRKLIWLFLLLGVAVMLVVFYPVLTAVELPYDVWRRLMWIENFDCGRFTCGWI